ncbi:MAG TPA: hypothetical protein VEQ67_10335, partial [Mycobacterium sp.]|nr:hypothetical protein [Mycobacterium sp.]
MSLVPALAFADDDNSGGTDRAPVVLASAPPTAPTATADADDDHGTRCAAHPEACADQIANADAERVKFCA